MTSSFQGLSYRSTSPSLSITLDDAQDVMNNVGGVVDDKELVAKDVLRSAVVVGTGLTSIIFLTIFMYVVFCYPSLTALYDFV